MKKLLLLAVVAVMFIATPAMAREGAYIGGSLVSANIFSNDLIVGDYDPGSGYAFRIGHSFGSIALEGNVFKTTHSSSIYLDRDLTGVSLDLKLSFSPTNDPTQFYFLAGLGAYSFENTVGQEFTGTGVNLGGGMEYFFNNQVALNLGLIYRVINYDEYTSGGITTTLNPAYTGDTITAEVGLNLYF